MNVCQLSKHGTTKQFQIRDTEEGTGKGVVKGMEGKQKGNYLRLIPELCLEQRMNRVQDGGR
jgi:hypothetical protein